MTTEAPSTAESDTVERAPFMDVLRSMTGHEEEAVEAAFGGRDIDSLPFGRQLRALVFVLRTRTGIKPAAAKAAVMEMTVRDVLNEFSDTAQPDPDAKGGEAEGDDA